MALFFASGLAALVYQVVWQRALFQSFGVNIESVTVIVCGLHVRPGVWARWWAACCPAASRTACLHLFVVCELAIGAFGLISLELIRQVGLS